MYSVPDRNTGLLELEELRRTCPGRIWNFVRHFLLVIELWLILIGWNQRPIRG
jgi:hypothetical protein